MSHTTDIDLETGDIVGLGSLDAVVSLFNRLGYDTGERAPLTPEAIGLAGDAAKALKKVELISEDSERFMRVVFAQSRSLTAKVRNDLARVLGKATTDHVVVLTADFTTLEFVFLDKRRKKSKGPAGIQRVHVVPKTISVNRRTPTRLDLRILRRLTWTCQDALDQFDKLRSVFDAAVYTGQYFQNRALFSDYFLRERLREDDNWRANPTEMFSHVRDFMQDASSQWAEKEKDVVRKELYEPLFKKLGFTPRVNRPSKTDQTLPDYLLKDKDGNVLSAAFVYQWDRWLDGPDLNDPDTPEENPGGCVVSALDEGIADWIIVTNGRHWRLYGKQAHARSTNFYEVDIVEALTASGDTDPNEAFRYWWLFFRPEAYMPVDDGCWLDAVLQGSRDYAKRLGNRLKDRVFLTIFPHLAKGFLEDRKKRLDIKSGPSDDELGEIFDATLTFLYRLLFLLYSESRDLVPIREAPYQAASLKRIKEGIAEKAGVAEREVADLVMKAYSSTETTIYDRLAHLFHAMDKGDSVLNVPTYNGGLFNTEPDATDRREHRISQFLVDHKIPDRQLALAVDRLARDQDERTLALEFIDYKSLEVRHLGSIYEGLLEFKLKVASEDLTTKTDKGKEKYISLSKATSSRRRQVEVVVRKNEIYLSNDKAERKASGSYYTPDPIVQYIVANTVGPVLDEKLEALRAEFRRVRRTFNNEIKKAKVAPIPQPIQKGEMDERQWANLKTYQAHKELVERLFDMHVCDPAMGSGHFLVEVVDFVTDRMLKFLNQFPINPVNYALERTRSSIIDSLGKQGVTVDPANLTDINLLKRHILKRCVYGVDLNPMAVELAKVSLWLDCFTLGAPLNFLDHHLRCGNSLIGATFNDLEKLLFPEQEYTKDARGKTTAMLLFGLDYEPLIRAIKYVLQVSKLADATAAEVATSVTQYDAARQALTGYEVILDLLVAKHFGFPTAPGIVEHGQNIDLSTRDTFHESLEDDDERQLVLDVEELAKQRDRHFFHWEIEFPEIFFGFIDTDHRQIRHKDEMESGSAGFDCVVGNPPYVRVQRLGHQETDFYFASYSTLSSKTDLSQVFLEQSIRLIHDVGLCSFIMSSQWMSTNYGRKCREFLARGYLREVVDFGSLPVFADASTYPAILIASPSLTEQFPYRGVESLDFKSGDEIKEIPSQNVSVASLSDRPWSLGSLDLLSVLEMRRASWTPLGELFKAFIGTLTGKDEAFVLTLEDAESNGIEPEATLPYAYRGEEVSAFSETDISSVVIYPYANGDDGRPVLWDGAFFKRNYPNAWNHLGQFRSELELRKDSRRLYATGAKWFCHLRPGSFNYINPQKLIIKGIARFPVVGLLRSKTTFNGANCPAIIQQSEDLTPDFVAGILQSAVLGHYLRSICPPKLNNYRRFNATSVNSCPIPRLDDDDDIKRAARISDLARQCRETVGQNCTMNELNELLKALDDTVAELFRLSDDERELIGQESANWRYSEWGLK